MSAGVEGYEWFNIFDNGGSPPKIGEVWRCPRCGTTRLECVNSGQYETSVRCPDCKIWTVVHDG